MSQFTAKSLSFSSMLLLTCNSSRPLWRRNRFPFWPLRSHSCFEEDTVNKCAKRASITTSGFPTTTTTFFTHAQVVVVVAEAANDICVLHKRAFPNIHCRHIHCGGHSPGSITTTTTIWKSCSSSARSLSSASSSIRHAAASTSTSTRSSLAYEVIPSYDISSFKGYRIRACLCVDRLPLLYVEAEHHRRWRLFKERWLRRLNSSLVLDNSLTLDQLPSQFLETREEREKRELLISKLGTADVGELEHLLTVEAHCLQRNTKALQADDEIQRHLDRRSNEQRLSEGKEGNAPQPHHSSIPSTTTDSPNQTRPPHAALATKQKRRELKYRSGQSFGGYTLDIEKVLRSASVTKQRDADMRSLERKPTEVLYLLVKYSKETGKLRALASDRKEAGSFWSFPFVDRIHPQTTAETLTRLCVTHFGEDFRPFVVSECPFTFAKTKYSQNMRCTLGLLGKKTFFYRGHHIPGNPNVQLPSPVTSKTRQPDAFPGEEADETVPSLHVRDVAWVTYDELCFFLSEDRLNAVKHGLYLP